MYYYNEDDILMEKISQMTLVKNQNYPDQIKKYLNGYRDLYQNAICSKHYNYSVVAEYNDVVIVKLDPKGKISV